MNPKLNVLTFMQSAGGAQKVTLHVTPDTRILVGGSIMVGGPFSSVGMSTGGWMELNLMRKPAKPQSGLPEAGMMVHLLLL